MRSYYHHFRNLLLCVFVCAAIPAISFSQGTSDWTLEAPPDSVELISVQPGMAADWLNFTFKNVSGKTIIEFRVDDLHSTMIGLDGFMVGEGMSPGASFSLTFGTRELSLENQSARKLRVAAIFYGDGSRAGSEKTLAQVEDEMLGAALETKRDFDLLQASPDRGISGLDQVAAQVGSQLPRTKKEAADALRGIALPGVSQAYTSKRLDLASGSLVVGVSNARQKLLLHISEMKRTEAAVAAKRPSVARTRALQQGQHALSDLATRYSSLVEFQAGYIKALEEKSHER